MDNALPPRRIVPRWKAAATTLTSVEQQATSSVVGQNGLVVNDQTAQIFSDKLKEWQESPSVGLSADVLAFGVFPELWQELKPVAEAIQRDSKAIPKNLWQFADRILGHVLPDEHEQVFDEALQRITVRKLRARLANNPANPIVLVDLARAHASLGNHKSAERALMAATNLAPSDRFVLRSAARFHVHRGTPDIALNLLRRSGRLTTDPWLIATEIAVSAVAERTSKSIRAGRTILDKNLFSPEHTAELASALGSIELNSGRNKEAKRLFRLALKRPNENTVAQIRWDAVQAGVHFEPLQEWFQNSAFNEFRCLTSAEEGDFESTLAAAWAWHSDEPFSSRPMLAASFSAGILGRMDEAEKAIRSGLVSNPGDISLMNNLAWTLATQDKLDEASEALHAILRIERNKPAPNTLANLGQYLIRSGFIEDGEKFYRLAVSKFDLIPGFHHGGPLALAFLSKELYLKNSPNWRTVLHECEARLNKRENLNVRAVIRSFLALDLQNLVDMPNRLSSRRPPEWKYDPGKNILYMSSRKVI